MDPKHVQQFVNGLRRHGLAFLSHGKCVDIAVVDQQLGPTQPCDCVGFARLPFGEHGGHVATCWLFEEPRRVAGLHLPGLEATLATPVGWTYEGSLSERFAFMPSKGLQNRFKYLRTENGIEVFLDRSTGREVFKPRQ
jgi:hypothetical protein